MNATYVSPSPLTRGISVFVEAHTGIYSFFFGGGGGGRERLQDYFFFFGRGGKPSAIEGQTTDILRKISVGNMPIHRVVL